MPFNTIKMATTTQIRLRGRPAHTQGPTYLSYTPDGTKLVTVGSNNTTRVYKTGFDGEPTNIDDCQEQNMGVDSTVRLFHGTGEYKANASPGRILCHRC
jgi:chromosome transmission fidelity protein 4